MENDLDKEMAILEKSVLGVVSSVPRPNNKRGGEGRLQARLTNSKETRRRRPLASLNNRPLPNKTENKETRKPPGPKTETKGTQTEDSTEPKTETKGTQTEDSTESIDYQLCCNDPPPPLYWEVMAEKRRVALTEAIDENERLWNEIEFLGEKVQEGMKQSQNAAYFAFMYKLVAKETKQL